MGFGCVFSLEVCSYSVKILVVEADREPRTLGSPTRHDCAITHHVISVGKHLSHHVELVHEVGLDVEEVFDGELSQALGQEECRS